MKPSFKTWEYEKAPLKKLKSKDQEKEQAKEDRLQASLIAEVSDVNKMQEHIKPLMT